MISLQFSCIHYGINDKGIWREVKTIEDSLIDMEYSVIDGRVYFGSFDYNFYDKYLKPQNKGFIDNIDILSFEICEGTFYARDKNHVYYPTLITCVDGYEFGGCFTECYTIQNADPQKFKYIRDGYAVSGNHMFYDGEEIKWRDDVLIDTIDLTLRNNEYVETE